MTRRPFGKKSQMNTVQRIRANRDQPNEEGGGTTLEKRARGEEKKRRVTVKGEGGECGDAAG